MRKLKKLINILTVFLIFGTSAIETKNLVADANKEIIENSLSRDSGVSAATVTLLPAALYNETTLENEEILESTTMSSVDSSLVVTEKEIVQEDFNENLISQVALNSTKDSTVSSETVTESTEILEVTDKIDNVSCFSAEIGDVRNLKASATDSFSVNLTWTAPERYPNCILSYAIEICEDKGKCVVEEVPNKCKISTREECESRYSLLVSNLLACTNYTFRVKAIGEFKASKGMEVRVEMELEKLGAPLSLTAISDLYSLHISWEPPAPNVVNCIKHYRITLEFAVTKMPKDTNITIDNLNSCRSYVIRINAVHIKGGDGDMVAISSPSVLGIGYTLNATQQWYSNDSVTIQWEASKAKSDAECMLRSVVTTCNYSLLEGEGYEPQNGTATVPVEEDDSKEPSTLVNVTIFNLSPYTHYNCQGMVIVAEKDNTFNSPTFVVNVTTLEDVPSAPDLVVAGITDTRFILEWTKPQYLPGRFLNVEIILMFEFLYPVPPWCYSGVKPSSNISDANATSLNYYYKYAAPYSKYIAVIRAATNAGWSEYSPSTTFLTKPAVPGKVSNFSCKYQPRQNDVNVMDTILNWQLPCFSNGKIEAFNISVYGSRNNCLPHVFWILKNMTGNDIRETDTYDVVLGELKGEYSYTFEVSAKVSGVSKYGAPETCQLEYVAGIPPPPQESYVNSITLDPDKTRRTTSSVTILLPLFPDTSGQILYYAIMVAQVDHNEAVSKRFNVTEKWPDTPSWEESMQQDFRIPYQPTQRCWDPYRTNHVVDYGHMMAVKYTIGEDLACKEISLNTDKRLYCNGPLNPDTMYHVRMRAFTRDGYSDSIAILIKTNAELNVPLVIGIVFGILFLGIFTTMMLLVRKCSPQAVVRSLLHSDMPGSPVPSPFTRKKFLVHCQELADNPGKLSNEFQLLQTLSVDLQMPTNTACLQANRKKNRYSDILPYDFSRVKLEVIDNDPNTDYINASFIKGFTGEEEYIACQGPKEETTYDFWRMVDQYDVKIIVMLTQLVEKGKEKCHQYFPTIKETFTYENMSIRCTSELDFRTYTQRTLVLQKENKKRCITHLHFKDWPDHDVPEDFDPTIHFCQILRRHINANKGYVVIHCSAGIGRTGTLIAIDILLQYIRDNRKLDVFGTVYRLRHHRINMVQRESQYAYIYNCIKQVLKNPYFLKTYKPPPVDHPTLGNASRKKRDTLCSNSNLVDSVESLKKSPFSTSTNFTQPIYESSTWSALKAPTNIFKSGLRYCKSTGALDDKVGYKHSGKFGAQKISYVSVRNSGPSESSTESIDGGSILGSNESIYENISQLTGSESADVFERDEARSSEQDTLVKDTQI